MTNAKSQLLIRQARLNQRMIRLVRVLLLLAMFCVIAIPSATFAAICPGCREFVTNSDSASIWIRDGDPRQGSPTQKRGTLTSLKFGSDLMGKYHPIFQDTLVFTGDTNSDGNGVPAGHTVVACTLWITPTSLYFIGVNEIVYDLYSVDQPWNESDGNAVSWNNRLNDIGWSQPGVAGTLETASVVKLIRFDANSYKWFTNVGGSLTLWDSVLIASGDSVPVVLTANLAEGIHRGTKYGLVLKIDSAASAIGINHAFATSEGATAARRPQFQWVSVETPPSEYNPRRRTLLLQTAQAKVETQEARGKLKVSEAHIHDNSN